MTGTDFKRATKNLLNYYFVEIDIVFLYFCLVLNALANIENLKSWP